MEDNNRDSNTHSYRYYHDSDYGNEILTYPHSEYFWEIRLSIFFIAALCVGVPCLIWAFYFVHLQKRTRSRISAFIILLLLCDLLQLLLYIYIVSKLLSFSFFHGVEIIMLGYFCLKVCGVHLQQLVALEGVLTLKYPLISAHIFSTPCYIIFSIIILIFPVMCALLVFGYPGSHGFYLSVGSILAPVCLLVVTGIITCKAPPTPARTPDSDNKPGASLFLVTMVTLVVLYLPCVLLHCVQILFFHVASSWLVICHCLLSLTVISEPLQCVLVCRENLRAQTNQTHIELNTEQTSV